MKKHLSLFLALLLLFSALLAFPAEAVQPEQTKDISLTPSTREGEEAPRATDLYSAGDSTMGSTDPGFCYHSYKIVNYGNGTYHKKVCNKCGNTLYLKHQVGYKYVNSSTCRKYCTVCQYVYSNTAHTYPSTWDTTSTMHTKRCTKCQALLEQGAHSNFKNYKDNGNGTHTKYCGVCNKAITENHTNNRYSYFTDEYCQVTCTCGFYKFQAHVIMHDAEDYCKNCKHWFR